jgi:hypothetical protein
MEMAARKYPFDRLVEIGDAFDVPMASVNERSFRSYVYQMAASLGKPLSIRALRDEGVFEVSLSRRAAEVIPISKARPAPARRTLQDLQAEVSRLARED